MARKVITQPPETIIDERQLKASGVPSKAKKREELEVVLNVRHITNGNYIRVTKKKLVFVDGLLSEVGELVDSKIELKDLLL